MNENSDMTPEEQPEPRPQRVPVIDWQAGQFSVPMMIWQAGVAHFQTLVFPGPGQIGPLHMVSGNRPPPSAPA